MIHSLAALAALALAATGSGPEMAMVFPGAASEGSDLAMGALPPPPDRVYLETRSFGTVLVDHRAHLERRVQCKACHGEGQVRAISFTPRSAHDRCRTCHVTLSRGPTSCRACHVEGAEPPVALPGESVRFVHLGPDGQRVASATSSRAQPPPSVVAATLPTHAPIAAPRGDDGAISITSEAEDDWYSYRKFGEVGFSMARVNGVSSIGPSLRFSTWADRFFFTESLDWTSGRDVRRTTGLLGLGVAVAVNRRVDLLLSAIGGAELRYSPSTSLRPALGGGAELQWCRTGFPQVLGLSVSGISTLGPTRDIYGERLGGIAFTMALRAGFLRIP